VIRRKRAFAGQLFLPMRIFSPWGRYAAESGVHPMSRTAGCRFGCARLRKTKIIQFIQCIRVGLGDLEGVFARRNFRVNLFERANTHIVPRCGHDATIYSPLSRR
jgi:hypothetical protein